jgi:flagellar hook assembly protein FlgD
MKLQTQLAVPFLILLNLVICNQGQSQSINSQSGITPGTLTFTVKTITNNSTYSPKNVLAIWIKDSQGNFVVSRKVMAGTRKQHLVKWNASSLGNAVSATTGATLTSHQVHTITWDGKNAAGTDMPDGIYQVWVEYVSTNAATNGNQGPSMSVEFTKGTAVQHLTPANETYYQNIVADWVPLTAGLNNLSKAGASVTIYPNPFSSETTVQLVCSKPSQAYICVFDGSGKKVAELLNDSFSAGTRSFAWDGSSDNGQKLTNGVYLFQIQVNGYTEIQKVLLNR